MVAQADAAHRPSSEKHIKDRSNLGQLAGGSIGCLRIAIAIRSTESGSVNMDSRLSVLMRGWDACELWADPADGRTILTRGSQLPAAIAC